MSEPIPGTSQLADVKTPVASLDKHGNIKSGIKQEFAHYKEQQKADRAEKRGSKDTSEIQEDQQEVVEEASVKDDEAENKMDFSTWNWWNNARVMVGKLKSVTRAFRRRLIVSFAAGTCLRNLADAVSVPYHYRRYSEDRYSVYLSELGNDENGQPIPTLRILIYLPTKGRTTAVLGAVEEGEQMGKARKRGVMVHLAGGGFTMCVTLSGHPPRPPPS